MAGYRRTKRASSFASSVVSLAPTGSQVLVPSPDGVALSFDPASDPLTGTYAGPDRFLEFKGGTGGSYSMPYLLSWYFSPDAGFLTGGFLVVSNKRVDANGAIQGLSYDGTNEDPAMIGVSPDVNGPSIGIESQADGGDGNQSALAFYNLDEITGGATAYSAGFGKKRAIISGDGTFYWGANLSNTPYTSSDVKLGRTSGGIIKVQGIGATQDTSFKVNAPTGRTATIGTEINGSAAWSVNGSSTTSCYIEMSGTTVARMFNVSGSGRMAVGGASVSTRVLSVLGNNDGVAQLGVRRNSNAQTANIVEILDEADGILSRFNKGGYFITKKNAAPADADLSANEMALWFDPTNGAAALNIKAKQADGTVKTATVALA